MTKTFWCVCSTWIPITFKSDLFYFVSCPDGPMVRRRTWNPVSSRISRFDSWSGRFMNILMKTTTCWICEGKFPVSFVKDHHCEYCRCCEDCKKEVLRDPEEDYMLKDSLWAKIKGRRHLCLKCVEKRVGRKLTKDDFYYNELPKGLV